MRGAPETGAARQRRSPARVELPCASGQDVEDLFPLELRLRLRNGFGLALRYLSERPAFAALERGPWSVFVAISSHWELNTEAWPTQETIAEFARCSTRAVRSYVAKLRGFVRVRRERRADGTERLYYAPGPITLGELATFVDRFPKDRGKRPPAKPPEQASAAPPETGSGTAAEPASREPREPDPEEPSSCRAAVPEGAEEEQREVSKEEREIAIAVLRERWKRKHPKVPPPRWFDRGEVALVAECTAAISGDRETKIGVHRAAIEGAFAVSEGGPPSVRFIWAKLEHFWEHVERGRRKARADARARMAARETDVQRAIPGEQPRVSPEQMRADAERIFRPLQPGG